MKVTTEQRRAMACILAGLGSAPTARTFGVRVETARAMKRGRNSDKSTAYTALHAEVAALGRERFIEAHLDEATQQRVIEATDLWNRKAWQSYVDLVLHWADRQGRVEALLAPLLRS